MVVGGERQMRGKGTDVTEGRCEERGKSGCRRNSHLQRAHPTEIFSDNRCCTCTCRTLSIPLPSPSHCLTHPLHLTHSLPHLPFASHLPTMAATTGGSWICGECGKVCRSHGGLTKHSLTHKKHSRVRGVHNNFHRIYHPVLDGLLLFFPI